MADNKVQIIIEALGSSKVQGELGRIRGAFGKLKDTVFSLKGALAAAGAGLLAKSFLDVADANEQYLTTLETLLKSQEKANEKFKELNEFARETPFQINEVMDAFIMLKSMGLDPSIERMRILGDATSALGGGAEAMDGIARALGQIQAKGKVSAEELMQLAERGIPAYEILQEKLGMTAAEVANIGNSGVSAAVAIDAIFEGLGERFGGQMDKMSSKFRGMWEEIKSLWRDFQSMIMESGAFDSLKEALSDLREKMRAAFESGQAKEWADDIGAAISGAITIAGKLTGAISELWKVLKEFPEPVLDYFKNLRGEMEKTKKEGEALRAKEIAGWEKVVEFMRAWGEGILFVVKTIGSAFIYLVSSVGTLVKGLMKELMPVGDLLIGILTLDVGRIKRAWSDVVSTGKETMIKLAANTRALGKSMVDDYDEMLKRIYGRFGGLFDEVVKGADRAKKALKEMGEETEKAISGLLNLPGTSAYKALQDAKGLKFITPEPGSFEASVKPALEKLSEMKTWAESLQEAKTEFAKSAEESFEKLRKEFEGIGEEARKTKDSLASFPDPEINPSNALGALGRIRDSVVGLTNEIQVLDRQSNVSGTEALVQRLAWLQGRAGAVGGPIWARDLREGYAREARALEETMRKAGLLPGGSQAAGAGGGQAISVTVGPIYTTAGRDDGRALQEDIADDIERGSSPIIPAIRRRFGLA